MRRRGGGKREREIDIYQLHHHTLLIENNWHARESVCKVCMHTGYSVNMQTYSFSLTIDLQAEVSDVCGESDGSFEEIVEKVEEDIEETNE